jgi:hypothetical protein
MGRTGRAAKSCVTALPVTKANLTALFPGLMLPGITRRILGVCAGASYSSRSIPNSSLFSRTYKNGQPYTQTNSFYNLSQRKLGESSCPSRAGPFRSSAHTGAKVYQFQNASLRGGITMSHFFIRAYQTLPTLVSRSTARQSPLATVVILILMLLINPRAQAYTPKVEPADLSGS